MKGEEQENQKSDIIGHRQHDNITVMKKHAEVAPMACEKVGYECAASDACQLVTGETGQMMQLREVLNDMSHQQLRALALSWNVYHGDNIGDIEELYAMCSAMIDKITDPRDSQAIRRRIVTKRFFGEQMPGGSRGSGGHFDDDSDSDCEEPAQKPRARSSSPRVDLSVQHFECPICFDSVPSRSTFVMPCCGYEACHGCAKRTIEAHLAENRRMECIKCHSSFNSLGDDFMEQIAELLGPKSLIASKMKLALTSVPACRQCSRCNRIQLVNQESENFPTVTCKACGHEYCFDHGDAHAGKSCPLPTKEQIESEKHISRVCKRCPGCKMPTEKSGGCPHMSCIVCSCRWCWTCEKSRYGSREDRVELLNTQRNNSTNWFCALLFHMICFFAGPNSAFYGTNTCRCDRVRRNAYSLPLLDDDVHWENRAGHNNCMRWLLTRAVTLHCALQKASGCECLLFSYAVYGIGHVSGYLMLLFLKACWMAISVFCPLLWNFLSYLYTSCPAVDNAGTLSFVDTLSLQAVCLVWSLLNAIILGFVVGVLTSNMMPVFLELVQCALPGRERRWFRVLTVFLSSDYHPYSESHNGIVRQSYSVDRGLIIIGVSLSLFGLMPGHPDHHIWIIEFWFVWLLSQVHVAAHRQNEGWNWSDGNEKMWVFIWSVLATTLKVIMVLDHVGLCLIAGAASSFFYGRLLVQMNEITDPEEKAGNKRLKWIIGIMTVLLIIGVVPSTRHYLLL